MGINLIIALFITTVAAVITFIITKQIISMRNTEKIDKLENEIKSKTNEIDFLKQKQTKFWNVVSHELKSLFYSFYNSIELLNTGYDQLSDEDKRELIKKIGRTYDQTLGIINELLEWVKANRRTQNSTPEFVNLSIILNENISAMKNKFEEKELIIDLEAGENIPVYCDKMMINFVIKSLLSNAIKFSHRKNSVRITCNKIGNKAEIVIADNGIGIPKENLEKLFSLDEIITTAGTENEKGSGLGLIVCKDFVEVNNGKLQVNSEFGKGTKVTVTLQGTEN